MRWPPIVHSDVLYTTHIKSKFYCQYRTCSSLIFEKKNYHRILNISIIFGKSGKKTGKKFQRQKKTKWNNKPETKTANTFVIFNIQLFLKRNKLTNESNTMNTFSFSVGYSRRFSRLFPKYISSLVKLTVVGMKNAQFGGKSA